MESQIRYILITKKNKDELYQLIEAYSKLSLNDEDFKNQIEIHQRVDVSGIKYVIKRN